jgi:DNA-binding NarL/FixJ family response regulator
MARSETHTDPITIVIADDHRSFGEAMQIALDREQDLTVVEVVGDGELAVTATLENAPDVVLMDLRMPGTDGIEATRRIRTQGGRSAIVILTGEDDDAILARAIQAGARGLLPKTSAIQEVATAVRRASKGEPLHRPAEVNRVLKAERSRSERDRDLERRVERLTPRELQILQAMADGHAPDAITEQLGMSRHTLRTHTQNILTKLGVHSKTDAVVAAIRFGKATPPGRAPSDRDVLGVVGNGGLEHVV